MNMNSGEDLFAPHAPGLVEPARKTRSYYELLEVSRNADRSEIRRAYIRLKGSLDKTQGAMYSLLEPQDSDNLLREIEEAYRNLDDEFLRRKYDHDMATDSGRELKGASARPSEEGSVSVAPRRRYSLTQKTALSAHEGAVREAVQAILDKAEAINGALIRSLREAVGVSMEEVENYLKISPHYIEAIEEDRFENLPPLVYCRGFIKSLLDYLGVDKSAEIVEGYSRNQAEWKKKNDIKKKS